MSEARVLRHNDGDVAFITLSNLKQQNALTPNMLVELVEAFDDVAHDESACALVIRGDGERAFSSGASLGETSFGASTDDASDIPALRRIRSFGKPVVASLQGHCYGGGLLLALTADARVSDSTVKFRMSAGALGIACPLESVRDLISIVGRSEAARLLLEGDLVDADDALRIGLVREVVPPVQLESRSVAIALRLASGAPLSIKAHKLAIRAVTVRSDLETEALAAIQAALMSRDREEGLRAMKERRSPRFKGR